MSETFGKLTQEEWERQGAEFVQNLRPTLQINASRTPEAIARDSGQAVMSEESMDYLVRTCQQWMASRVLQRTESGVGARSTQVTITVTFDGEGVENAAPFVLRAIDGGHRHAN